MKLSLAKRTIGLIHYGRLSENLFLNCRTYNSNQKRYTLQHHSRYSGGVAYSGTRSSTFCDKSLSFCKQGNYFGGTTRSTCCLKVVRNKRWRLESMATDSFGSEEKKAEAVTERDGRERGEGEGGEGGEGEGEERGTGFLKVAVAQMTSTSDIDKNFETCKKLVKEASACGVVLLSLPECFSFIGEKEGQSLTIAEPLDGPIMKRYQNLAKEEKIWLSLGGFQEKGPDSSHLYNTHVLLDDKGGIQSTYRKIHLFDVDVKGGPKLKESESTVPGGVVGEGESPVGKLGLTICYDLRFPELFQNLRFSREVEILLVPSAFTKKTGEAHWEVLLRARAIECQCYVLAAAQAGRHNERRESFGNSLIVDPWGVVVSRLEDPNATGIAIAEINPKLIQSIRERMPVSQHRRYDVYGSSSDNCLKTDSPLPQSSL